MEVIGVYDLDDVPIHAEVAFAGLLEQLCRHESQHSYPTFCTEVLFSQILEIVAHGLKLSPRVGGNKGWHMSDVLNVNSFGSDPVDDYVRRQIMIRLAELWRSMDPVHNLSNEALVRLIRTGDQKRTTRRWKCYKGWE